MNKTISYRLYPTEEQRVIIAKTFGCTRYVYNRALALRKETYEKEKKHISRFDLCRKITEWKHSEETSWLKEVNAQSLQQSIVNLDSAFIKFFRIKNGFPKFKNKKCHRYSYRLPQGVKINFGEHKIYLPGLKWVNIRVDRIFDSRICSATVVQVPSGKYFVRVLIDDGKEFPKKPIIEDETSVGIDLGVKDFAIFSTGEKIANPRFTVSLEQKLAKEQRKLARKNKGSNRYEKQRVRVAKVHEKVFNKRLDFLHKLSSKLTKENQFSTICLETLNIAGMVKNHSLSKSIHDVSWRKFIELIKYKAEWYGKNILYIGQYEPSTKLCDCGYKNNELTLADRVWTCPVCGRTYDRDVHAAENIKKIALADINLKYHNSGLGKSVELVELLH